MNIKIINPIKFQGWDELILSGNDYSFFHSSAWAKVLFETYNFNPLYFIVLDNNEILDFIPVMEIKSFITGKRGVSLPFSDFCEPITSEKGKCINLIKKIIEFGKNHKWKFFELRGEIFSDENIPSSAIFYHHTLNLKQNEEQILSSFRESTKRNIKKANNDGVYIDFFYTREALNEFYRLHCITRKYHGLPPQPKLFFKKVFEHIISKKKGFVVLSSFNNITVAGGIYFHFGEKALFKYGASNREYNYLRANYLIMWEAIKWYYQNGFKNFSLGRTHPENTGLMQFKDGWGTKRSIINYYKYNFANDAFVAKHSSLSKWYNPVFRKMPTPILKLIGSFFYRHMG